MAELVLLGRSHELGGEMMMVITGGGALLRLTQLKDAHQQNCTSYVMPINQLVLFND